MNEKEELQSIQFFVKSKYYWRLVKLKGTKQTWFDFLCRPILRKEKELQELQDLEGHQ